MNDEKIKIITSASQIFFSRGFSKIPVDEVATALKMSKKTIYKHFPTKDILITEVIHWFLKTHSLQIKMIMDSDRNAVEKIFTMTNYLGNQILKVSDKWFFDIYEYSNDLWQEIEKFRHRIMIENLTHVIEQGIAEGLFINKPVPVMMSVILSSIKGVVNPEFTLKNKLHPAEALKETIDLLMSGMLTYKGKKIRKKLISENL